LRARTPVRLGAVTDVVGGGVPEAAAGAVAQDFAGDVPKAAAVEPQDRNGVLRQLPLALVIGGAALGLVIIGLHHFRWGNLLIAGSLLVAAFFRLVLPTRRAGLLAIRSRFTDVATMSVMGGSLMLLALITST
jgi:hypothetical protein